MAHMAKRDDGIKGTTDNRSTNDASDSPMADAMERRVVAFAEQLGRIAGTVQARTEGWMDRETLTTQVTKVRDAAAELLERLAGGAARTVKTKPAVASGRGRQKGRSGGVVDAPGKKHRKPLPADPRSNVVSSQASKTRMARTMVKTNRRRGRG
jgi:hypothetical protein